MRSHRRNKILQPALALLALILAAPALAAVTPTPVIPAPAVTPAPDSSAHKKRISGKPEIGSLFFTEDEMAQIRAAIEVYARYAATHGRNTNSEAEDFINELVGARRGGESGYTYYPQFYLSELVYHSPADWTVRINNQQFTPDDRTKARLRIKEVDADKVAVEWHPGEMDLIDRSWDKTSNPDVMVDDGNGTVTFALRPNQTFSSYMMRPLEGRVLPVAISSANAAPVDVRNGKAAAVAPSFPPAMPAVNPRGLGGLIDAYHRGLQMNETP